MDFTTKTLTNEKGDLKAVIENTYTGFLVLVSRFDGGQWNALHTQNRRAFTTLKGAENYAFRRLA